MKYKSYIYAALADRRCRMVPTLNCHADDIAFPSKRNRVMLALYCLMVVYTASTQADCANNLGHYRN